MQKKKVILITLAAILICIFAAGFTIFKMNRYYLELSLTEEVTTLEYGIDKIPEVTALCKGTFINKEGTPVETTLEGELDFETLGTYNVTYTAVYKDIKISENRTFIIQDTTAPVIELVADPEYYTSPVAEYVEEGFTATDNYDGDITDKVQSEVKDGIVTYKVTDSSGNEATAERTIIYKDVIPPEIVLNGGADMVFNVGSDFKDPGFTATDDVDGNLTDKVSSTGKVDGKKEGTYTIYYSVADLSGNVCEVQRTVVVKDAKAPTLTLKGDASSYLLLGSAFTEPGFTAHDDKDGDLTSAVKVSGSVDTGKVGEHKITYSVSDKAGNTTKATRSVFVYKKQETSPTVNPGNKVVYLTFDDGPTKNTAQLLNILDKYNVKATFFVTNQFPAYQNMITETARRGHTIALHTYSHVFNDVYKSTDAYFADLQKIQDIVVKRTGKEASIVRFPGGTSNTISRKHCPGIMTDLTKKLPLYGYQYCDWNVDSLDAGGAKTSAAVAQNVINGMKANNISYVLQHDINLFSIKAVDEILAWGIANGYTFLPMDSSTPMFHHSPRN